MSPRGHLVIVPGRGVPVAVYSWVEEAGRRVGWRPCPVTDLFDDRDDRGGPAAYLKVADVVGRIAAADREQPIAVVGHSTGARVALHAARMTEVSGVIALCPIADLADHVRRVEDYLPDYYANVTGALGPPTPDNPAYEARSPIRWIDRITAPVLVVAATEDRVCPPYQAELLHAALSRRSAPVRLTIVPGAGHFFEHPGTGGTATPAVMAEIGNWLTTLHRPRWSS